MHTYNGLRLNPGFVDGRCRGGSRTPLRVAAGIRTRAQPTNAIHLGLPENFGHQLGRRSQNSKIKRIPIKQNGGEEESVFFKRFAF